MQEHGSVWSWSHCRGGTIRLALVISSLCGGGAERVMSTLANAWARRGVAVTLITLSDGANDAYQLDRKVRRVSLDLLRDSPHAIAALQNNWARIRRIRAAVRAAQSNVVVSFSTTTNMLAILSCLGTGIPAIVSERTSVADLPPLGIWAMFYRPVYRRAAAVVSLTDRGALWLEGRLQRAVAVIPNPLFLEHSDRGVTDAETAVSAVGCRRILLAMGRLNRVKGFDLLLKAFAEVAPHQREWALVILGEGSERQALERQARGLGIGDCVFMPGFLSDPSAAIARADAFVLSSRHEGMPMALLEAMGCGLPVISFDCPTGPAELIEHEVDGLLVPREDEAALAKALARVMSDASLRQRLGERARAVQSRFSVESVIARWDALLAAVMGQEGNDAAPRSAPEIDA